MPMHLSSRVLSVFVAMAVGLTLVGAPAHQGSGAARTDVLVIAKDISDIHTPDPGKSYDVGGVFLQFPVYSRLVRQRAPDFWKIQPDLAESWSVAPDATTYPFKPRKDAVLETGKPATSEA